MNLNDNLGTRMKEFYENRAKTYLTRRMPVAIRIDGKAFHTFTRGFQKPFDKIFMESMQETMKYLCENIQGCVFGYTQSDEITLILIDYQKLTSDAWFDYQVQKMCSVAASIATMKFNQVFGRKAFHFRSDSLEEELNGRSPLASEELFSQYYRAMEHGAMFDARCFNIPKEEVCNLIYWRQLDATRNSIQSVGQANFSHRELEGKSCNKIQDMLLTQKGINWNDYPTVCKRGTACYKDGKITAYNAKTSEFVADFGFCGWKLDTEMPILKGEDRQYVDRFIYVGEET